MLLEGPIIYFWLQRIQPRIAPISTKTNWAKFSSLSFKVVIEAILFTPFYYTIYIHSVGFMNGKSLPECTQDFKNQFWDIYLIDIRIWPFLQFINFGLVPIRFQAVFVYIASIFWDSFLSYQSYENLRKSKEIEDDLNL